MEKSKILAVIPARGGSRGVPRKNIRLINGKPLVWHTLTSALESGVIDRVVVSTEDQEIKEIVSKFGGEVIDRPMELASDTATNESVMSHALEVVEKQGYHPDYIVLIQCTSPLLSKEVIREAVSKVIDSNKFDTCITVFYPDTYEFEWTKGEDGLIVPKHDPANRPMRQDMELPYQENGAFYITKAELFKKTKNRFGGKDGKVTAVLMSEEDSIQIDSENQLWLAEQILKRREKK
ncbi:MAG: acylneuraminate cytidylyltransferase family protein [bacterium]|nr:acylneuraminate cytidylyltransferase family protein [bacterium]